MQDFQKEIRIFSGNLEIIGSGTVRTGYSSELLFEIDDLKFIFKFTSDKEKDQGLKIDGDTQKKELIFEINDSNRPTAIGLINPVPVGAFRGRKLYLSFESRKETGANVWALEYTFFWEKE